MKKIFYIPILFIMLYATGFKNADNNKITLQQNFNRIVLHGNMKVILVQRSNDSDIQYKNGKITAEVRNGELNIKKKNSLFNDSQPFVIIPVQQLNAIKIMDDATVFTQGAIKTGQLVIDSRGDGTIKLTVAADSVFVRSRGKGKVQIDGSYNQTLAKRNDNGDMVIEYSNAKN